MGPDARAPSRPASPAAPVRRAGLPDLEAIMDRWLEITSHHANLDRLFVLRPDARPEATRLVSAMLRDPDVAAFVWDEGGQVEGLCIVRVDRAPPIAEEVRRAEITDLGVRSGRRRRGIGSALVARALEWVADRGVARVEVRVATRNEEGQAFWRHLGFGDLMDVLQKRL